MVQGTGYRRGGQPALDAAHTPPRTLPAVLRHAILPHVGKRGAPLDGGIAQLFFHTCRVNGAPPAEKTQHPPCPLPLVLE